MGRTHPPIPSCPSNHLLNTNHPSHSVSLFFLSLSCSNPRPSLHHPWLVFFFFFFFFRSLLVRSAFPPAVQASSRSLKARRRCARPRPWKHGSLPTRPPFLSIFSPPSFRPQRSTFVHTFSHEVNLRILTGSHSLTMFDRRLEHLHAPGALDAAHGSASNTARPRPNSRLVSRFFSRAQDMISRGIESLI